MPQLIPDDARDAIAAIAFAACEWRALLPLNAGIPHYRRTEAQHRLESAVDAALAIPSFAALVDGHDHGEARP